MTHPVRIVVALIKIAAVYLLVSLAIGIYMAITHNHALATIHTHVVLLGWATMAVTGLVYLMLPACGGNRPAAAHSWLHTIGLPVDDRKHQSSLRSPAARELTERPLSDAVGTPSEPKHGTESPYQGSEIRTRFAVLPEPLRSPSSPSK